MPYQGMPQHPQSVFFAIFHKLVGILEVPHIRTRMNPLSLHTIVRSYGVEVF